jgi:hypothetical protein
MLKGINMPINYRRDDKNKDYDKSTKMEPQKNAITSVRN